jgi:4-hydroxy-3-methylbut-2-enyl diphosphate reductase
VELAYSKADKGNVYTYGPIIHNKEVTADLEKHGVFVTENFDCGKDGCEIIIRSHGVPKSVYDELEQKGIEYTDCTCPFVKKIHNIVHDAHSKEGRTIIIIGNAVHPEVIGINGWCDNSAVIINSLEEAENFEGKEGEKYSLVVQTTFQIDVYNKILDCLKSKISDLNVNYTICSATNDRQKEAIEIAKKVDAMIVLGDKNSSNTRKLYEISKKYCKKVYLCEKILDLQLKNVLKCDRIGITAGASTPQAIIKEAIKAMSDVNSENKSFAEMMEETLVTLRTGDIVKGTVIGVSETGEVSVNLGYKSDGIITKAEFSDDASINPADVVKAGDEIEVFIIRVNDVDGNVLLSKKKVDANKSYVVIEEAYNNNTTIKAKVTDVVKGGLIALVEGSIKVFVPSSQISNRYVEDLESFKGNEYDFNVLEYDRSKKRIVVGRKALAQKEIDDKKAEVFANISAGSKLEGTVSRIVEFGAFVDLGGVDGLIHISELRRFQMFLRLATRLQ